MYVQTISCTKRIRASNIFLFGVFTLLLSYMYFSSYFFRWRSTSLDKYSRPFYEIWWVLLLVTILLRLNCNKAVHFVDNLYDAPEWARRKEFPNFHFFAFLVLGTSICQLFYFQFSGSNLSLTLIQFPNWKVHFLYLVRFPLCQYFIIGKICVSYITAVPPVSLYLVHNGVGNSSNLSEPFFNESNSSFTFRFVGS